MKNRFFLVIAICLVCASVSRAAGVLWSNASHERSTALAELYWNGGNPERELGDYQANWKNQPVYFFRLTSDSTLTDDAGNNALVSIPDHPAMSTLAGLALKGAITPLDVVNALSPFGTVLDATALLDGDSLAEGLGQHSFFPGQKASGFYLIFSKGTSDPLSSQPPAALISSVSSVTADEQTVSAALFQDDTLLTETDFKIRTVPEPSITILLALSLSTLALRRRVSRA